MEVVPPKILRMQTLYVVYRHACTLSGERLRAAEKGVTTIKMKTNISKGNFLKRVSDSIRQGDLLRKGDRVLVAVSGGPDSVCLLKVLCDLSRQLGIEIVAANLDHGIRGKESREDSLFVKELAAILEIEFVHKRIDLKSKGKGKLSLEERARDERYKFFREACEKYSCGVIATGHTACDQAETMIMRMITGTSLQGFSGIPLVRYEGDIKVVRPLLRISKEEILDHLKKTKWGYRLDHTNEETKHLRNKIRIEVLPFLERYNPSIRTAMANLAESVSEDLEYIEDEKKKVLSRFSRKKGTKVKAKLKDLLYLPAALRKDIVKTLFEQAGGNVKKLTYRHWKDVDLFIRTAVKGKSLDLPGKITINKSRDTLEFNKTTPPPDNRSTTPDRR